MGCPTDLRVIRQRVESMRGLRARLAPAGSGTVPSRCHRGHTAALQPHTRLAGAKET